MIDSHCHLTDQRIDLDSTLKNMGADGLSALITVGYDMATSKRCLEIAKENENVFATVGVHPSDVFGMQEDDLTTLFEMSQEKKVVGIGEIGMDYHYEDTDKEKQKYWLCRQLELVERAKLPAVFHLRDAYDDMLKIIKDNRRKLVAGGVMHCFSGSVETAKEYLDMGFFISLSGTVTFKNARKTVEVAKIIPDDRLLAETDCPYLAPEPFRGQLNLPKYVKHTIQKLAELRQKDFLYIEEITANNAKKLFSKIS